TALPPDNAQIPAFNPFKLYANLSPISSDGEEGSAGAGARDVTVSFIDLPGGRLVEEDGMELPEAAVMDLVAQSDEIIPDEPYAMRPAIFNEEAGAQVHRASFQPGDMRPSAPAETLVPRNTTIVERTTLETAAAILEGAEVKLIPVKRGNTLMSLLVDAGTERWQAKAIADAMAPTFLPSQLQPGQQVRLTLAPAPSDSGQMDPVRVSVFTGDHHEVTVARNDGGEYVASSEAVELSDEAAVRAASYPQRATLYTSFYHAALSQSLPADAIQRLLRVHSYDIDFKQPVRPGDSFEVFFDLKDDGAEAGELLYTAMTVEGETRRFYRFRTPDGDVDFYDRDGNSAKKFLMRKPVKGGRFTSGFGMRRHPVLGGSKMHLGTDWGAPHGTPILAAGSGVVEAVGRKGGYGNYVRIRHANGYKTAYGHMSSFAENLRPGAKVQQGQVIGLVGNTGISSGPHLHFEVLVNNRHVNPMTIPVPRGKQLTGRQLAEFYKERARIDELMGRSPVNTRVAAVGEEIR
ncbi:MAG: peptidoglycan DD-metalloendopeptidase family protein, partial [Pseudomonadota bacterium]|nr:peptidoglycan DD-metalloendopeptidase family protein [Pseudomonadota bacterium]